MVTRSVTAPGLAPSTLWSRRPERRAPVTMTTEQYTRYVFALGSYATIITARDMMKTGRSVPPASIMDKNPFQDEYAALFGVKFTNRPRTIGVPKTAGSTAFSPQASVERCPADPEILGNVLGGVAVHLLHPLGGGNVEGARDALTWPMVGSWPGLSGNYPSKLPSLTHTGRRPPRGHAARPLADAAPH